MSEPGNFFDRIDPVELELATSGFAVAMMNAGAAVSRAVIDDDRISPDGLIAGICRAHALGLASAIAGAGGLLGLEGSDLARVQALLIGATFGLVTDTVREANGGALGGRA